MIIMKTWLGVLYLNIHFTFIYNKCDNDGNRKLRFFIVLISNELFFLKILKKKNQHRIIIYIFHIIIISFCKSCFTLRD